MSFGLLDMAPHISGACFCPSTCAIGNSRARGSVNSSNSLGHRPPIVNKNSINGGLPNSCTSKPRFYGMDIIIKVSTPLNIRKSVIKLISIFVVNYGKIAFVINKLDRNQSMKIKLSPFSILKKRDSFISIIDGWFKHSFVSFIKNISIIRNGIKGFVSSYWFKRIFYIHKLTMNHRGHYVKEFCYE